MTVDNRGRRGGVDFAAGLRQLWLGVSAQTRGTRRSVTTGLYPPAT